MRRLWTPAWLVRHALAAVLVVTFLGLAWWQLSRATGGNTLSWGYTLQWPAFAGFVIFIWWREVRRALGSAPASASASPGPASTSRSPGPARRPVITRRAVTAGAEAYAEPADVDLTAYNRYLAWLNANPGAKPADYPG